MKGSVCKGWESLFQQAAAFCACQATEKFPVLITGHKSCQSMMQQINRGGECAKGRKRTDQPREILCQWLCQKLVPQAGCLPCPTRGCAAKEVHAAKESVLVFVSETLLSFVQKQADRQSDNDNNKTKGKTCTTERVQSEPDCPERLCKFLHCYSILWKIKIFKPLSWMTGEDRSNLEQTDGSDDFLKFLWSLSSVTNIHMVFTTLCKLFSKIK